MKTLVRKFVIVSASTVMLAAGMIGLVGATQPAGAATVQCKTAAYEVSSKNVLGQKVTTLTDIVRYCYDGSRLTSVTPTYSHSEQYLNKFQGIVGRYTEGGAGSTYYKSYYKAKWSVCYPTPWGSVCPSSVYSWIVVTVSGNGAQSAQGAANQSS